MTGLGGPDPEDPAAALMQRLAGKWITQALATAAELGLAEALTEPADLESLARTLECRPSSLLRLLRVLVGEGALHEQPDGRYALTPMGAQLRADALGTLARFVGSPSQWTPWTELTYAVRTGKSAFERVHGQPLFEYLAAHPEQARLYDEAVDAFTAQQACALAARPALDGALTVVDVGGGRGTLLAELLRQRPRLRGILFDRADVVEAAKARFEAERLHERCAFEAGDFFEAVPGGADVYVIKHVLHNWDDDRAEAIVRRCVEAMPASGRVFVVEAIRLPGNRRDGARMFDLEMLVLTGGGRERSKPEFRRLLSRAGLRLESTARLSDGAWLMVGQRVD